jgi:hypothetical protein
VTNDNEKDRLVVEEDEFDYKPQFQQKDTDNSPGDTNEKSIRKDETESHPIGQADTSEQENNVKSQIQDSNDNEEQKTR